MKNIISASAITSLIFFSFLPFTLAKAHLNHSPSRYPHTEARPSSASVQNAIHHLDYMVNQDNLTEIIIQIPRGIEIGNIKVKNYSSSRSIPIGVKIARQQAVINFNEKISSGTQLSIELEKVKTPGYASTWSYTLLGKISGTSQKIPLGVVSVKTYD